MTTRTPTASPRRRRGSAAIEFALTAPLLALLTFGGLDYCWYFVQWQSVIVSAQVGARAGSQAKLADGPDVVAAHAAADALLHNYIGTVTDGAQVSASIIDGVMVQVNITVPFTPLGGYVMVPSEIRASTRMLIEDIR